MTEAVVKTKTPRKASAKPKVPRQHPPYGAMIKKAIAALKDRKGSSRQALIKYIRANYKIGPKENADLYVRMALRAGVKSGKLVQSKGAGASGSFKLPEKVKPVKAAAGVAKKKKSSPKKKAAAGGTKKKATPKKKKTTTKKAKKADAPAAASSDDAPAPAATPSKPKAKKTTKKPKSAAKKPVKRLGSAKKAAGTKKPKAKK